MAEPYMGQVIMWGGNFAPYGWASCNGAIMPIQQYTALFALIGVNYGGNGTSNFGLPDLRSTTPIGQGTMPGGSSYSIGETGGAETIQLTSPEMPSHSHVPAASKGSGVVNTPVLGVWAGDASGSGSFVPFAVSPPAPNAAMAPTAIGVAGSGGAHENRPPLLALNYCIAMSGIFPSFD